jgi:hypothetical protein
MSVVTFSSKFSYLIAIITVSLGEETGRGRRREKRK